MFLAETEAAAPLSPPEPSADRNKSKFRKSSVMEHIITEYGLHYLKRLFVRSSVLLSVGSVTKSVVKNLLTDPE